MAHEKGVCVCVAGNNIIMCVGVCALLAGTRIHIHTHKYIYLYSKEMRMRTKRNQHMCAPLEWLRVSAKSQRKEKAARTEADSKHTHVHTQTQSYTHTHDSWISAISAGKRRPKTCCCSSAWPITRFLSGILGAVDCLEARAQTHTQIGKPVYSNGFKPVNRLTGFSEISSNKTFNKTGYGPNLLVILLFVVSKTPLATFDHFDLQMTNIFCY